MSNITAKKITSTKVLLGVKPSDKALPVISNDVNPIIDDINYLENKLVYNHASITSANSTVTLTSAQVATGYITSTSAAGTTLTMPTGTLLGTYLNAVQGTTLDLYIDNTAGASTVTIAVGVNGILSALAATEAGGSGLLTIPSGITGQARFTLMFSSATAYTFTRTA